MTVVLVRPGSVHGHPMADYADALAARLDDVEIRLPETTAAEREQLPDATVVTGGTFGSDLLDVAETVEYFACSAAGTDHLPLETLSEAGIAVTNASGVHGPNIAEHVVGALLAFEREFFTARERQDRREWRSFHVGELAGSTVAVVGMGAIGLATLERLESFDVERVGVRHSPEKGGPADDVVGFDDIESAAAGADALVLACPLTEETEGLVDGAVLQSLSTEGILVNVARGPVVDTDALVSAIRRNAIGAAALDVTDPEPLPEDHPLWGFSNVLITPHVAGNTPAYFDRLADIVAGNVRRVERGDLDALENRVI